MQREIAFRRLLNIWAVLAEGLGMSDQSPRSLYLILDGLPRYAVDSDVAPFVCIGNGSDFAIRPMRTILGYSLSLYCSMWTGAFPDQHGVFTEFYLNPRDGRIRPGDLFALLPRSSIRRSLLGFCRFLTNRLGFSMIDFLGLPPFASRSFERWP